MGFEKTAVLVKEWKYFSSSCKIENSKPLNQIIIYHDKPVKIKPLVTALDF